MRVGHYQATILADSLSPDDVRLTTFYIVFPRVLLAEVNTHKMLSKNSASSRAVPPEKTIKAVCESPFVPEFFTRVKGMGQGKKLWPEQQEEARGHWLTARDDAVAAAELLMHMNVAKVHVNRILEPFMWHSTIITGTDWFNFFALRCPPGDPDPEFPAQYEFQVISKMMLEALRESGPLQHRQGEWHLPLVASSEQKLKEAPMVSAGRCARISYFLQDEPEDFELSLARAEQLRNDWHMSPFEHQAMPMEGTDYFGNLRGWMPLRKLLPGEDGSGHQRPDLADILC